MNITFLKYQSTGNDFILIDARSTQVFESFSKLTRTDIARICDRRLGVGADGLILLTASNTADFEMKNYNSDGGECSMCGNGGRALIHFAQTLGIQPKSGNLFQFTACDGLHEAKIVEDQIHLKMKDVKAGIPTPLGLAFETGSPHVVCLVHDLENFNVIEEGKKIRHAAQFAPAGINANFVEMKKNQMWIRTFERGVEDETLSCGTGVIAAALAFDQNHIQTRGGLLTVQFEKSGSDFKNIWLIGPTEKTFEGTILTRKS